MKILKNLLVATVLVLQACTQPVENGAKAPDSQASTADLSLRSIQIALKPNKDVQGQREDEKLLSDELTTRLGIPVTITTPSSKAIIEAGLANKTIDLGYVSSGDAISFADNDVAEVLVAGQHESVDADGESYKGAYYYSVWLSLKDKPYTQISDLKNKPVAFASRTSTSGLLVPSWDLIKRGLVKEGGSLKDFFGENNVFYGTGYVSAVEQVLEGKAEAAAVSYYVYEKDKHLSQEQRNKLKVVQRQGPVASHTFCVRKTLPNAARTALKDAMLTMVEEKPQLCNRLFGGTLVEVDPVAHLKPPREAKALVATLVD